jgi:hypothetical protein
MLCPPENAASTGMLLSLGMLCPPENAASPGMLLSCACYTAHAAKAKKTEIQVKHPWSLFRHIGIFLWDVFLHLALFTLSCRQADFAPLQVFLRHRQYIITSVVVTGNKLV